MLGDEEGGDAWGRGGVLGGGAEWGRYWGEVLSEGGDGGRC